MRGRKKDFSTKPLKYVIDISCVWNEDSFLSDFVFDVYVVNLSSLVFSRTVADQFIWTYPLSFCIKWAVTWFIWRPHTNSFPSRSLITSPLVTLPSLSFFLSPLFLPPPFKFLISSLPFHFVNCTVGVQWRLVLAVHRGGSQMPSSDQRWNEGPSFPNAPP